MTTSALWADKQATSEQAMLLIQAGDPTRGTQLLLLQGRLEALHRES